jgi:hypothetical protein
MRYYRPIDGDLYNQQKEWNLREKKNRNRVTYDSYCSRMLAHYTTN